MLDKFGGCTRRIAVSDRKFNLVDACGRFFWVMWESDMALKLWKFLLHKHNEDHTENCKLLVNNFVIPDAPCMVCLPTWTVKNGHMNKGKCRYIFPTWSSWVWLKSNHLRITTSWCKLHDWIVSHSYIMPQSKGKMRKYGTISIYRSMHTIFSVYVICIYNIQYICTPERCDRIVFIPRYILFFSVFPGFDKFHLKGRWWNALVGLADPWDWY